MALLDTGASVNVLPYEIGLQLGAVWEEQTVPIALSGNLGDSEARGVVLSGEIANFTPILLAFAWTQSNDAPVILGHLNFFAEFNVCFYRHELDDGSLSQKLGDRQLTNHWLEEIIYL